MGYRPVKLLFAQPHATVRGGVARVGLHPADSRRVLRLLLDQSRLHLCKRTEPKPDQRLAVARAAGEGGRAAGPVATDRLCSKSAVDGLQRSSIAFREPGALLLGAGPGGAGP